MSIASRLSEDVPSRIEPSDIDEATVRSTLNVILQSQPFRTSKQCQNLLAYIVEHSLQHDDAGLRERILGVEVFGRSPQYDTSEDPVVRMRAADVRKRLAQFYQSNDHAPAIVHIDLKPGSYRATFHVERADREETAGSIVEVAGPQAFVEERSAAATVSPLALEATRSHGNRGLHKVFGLAALIAGLVLALLGWKLWVPHASLQQRFWAPLTTRNQPVLLYVGSNVAYRFTADYMAQYQRDHGLRENGPEFFVDLPKGGTVNSDDLVPVKDTFVSVCDLAASTQVVSLMDSWKKPYVLRSASDVSISDFRNSPSVLIGAFNNRWALETTNDLPFSFRDGLSIVEKKNPVTKWTVAPENKGSKTEDFALISRLLHSNTGGPVLAIGGIGSYGTQAAAEFVTSSEKMNELLKTAPPGWETKNIQVVLRIKVVGYAPVGVDVAATSYW